VDLLYKIAIIQTKIIHKEPIKNFEHIVPKIKTLSDKGIEIILLPELFLTGPLCKDHLEAHPELKQYNLAVLERLKDLANKYNLHIIAGLLEARKNLLYNSLFLIRPNKSIDVYRKMHLFSPFKEEEIFNPGELPNIFKIQLNKGKELLLGLTICFDLRFPELFRYYAKNGAQIIFVSCLWPSKRKKHLKALLKARAIENQCFIVCANACGQVNNEEFAGASTIISPLGDNIVELDNEEEIATGCCDLSLVNKARKLFKSFYSPHLFQQRPCFKVVGLKELKHICTLKKSMGQKCVFTNGCFDLLHAGHVDYLRQARDCGDFLIVGLNSDNSIRSIKGESRPINSELDRAFVLASLAFVDYVVIFDDPTPINLINTLRPDILVKGADWPEEKIVGLLVQKK